VIETANRVFHEVGSVDILVCNAGILYQHSLFNHSEDEIRRIFDINAVSKIWMLQAFLPRMMENNKGHVVAVASMSSLNGIKNLVPYSATKAAFKGIMESMNQELRSSGNTKVREIKFKYCKYLIHFLLSILD
jgi:all-trans-retinol dehydrogenase (NAD+)